ncbi:MAG: hypothetical protein Q9163_005679 [Psora crenata]
MGTPDPAVELQRWLTTNIYHHKDFPVAELASIAQKKNLKITVIVPAREVAKYIGGVLSKTVKPLVDAQIVQTVIAIDADSADKTSDVARAHGATVLQRAKIATELGPSLGKGDAMWRALLETSFYQGQQGSSDNEIIAFLDGDTGDPSPSHLIGIIGPLIHHDSLQMVRGSFDRPFRSTNGDIQPHQGGRVTEILARPLINAHFPELAGFRQPLAGEFAARRGLLESLNFPVGYGVEVGTLIDAWRLVGLASLAECDLGTRQNDHKDLRQLGSMGLTILNAVERRLDHKVPNGKSLNGKMWLPWDRDYHVVSAVERPAVKDYAIQRKRTIPRPAFVDVPHMLNFRDIGGLAVDAGGSVRRGLVFRSGDFRGLTAMGIQRLLSLGIKAVFDLRSSQEVEKLRMIGGDSEFDVWSALPDGPQRYHVPVFADSDFSPGAMAKRFRDYSSKGVEGFERAYRAILLNSQPALCAILGHLAGCSKAPAPIIIHCTAGKDRTGVIVMILLLLAGCPKAVIAKEYQLTEVGLGAQWRAEAVARLLKDPVFQGENREGIERMVGARREVMEAVVDMVETDFGGVENFLTRMIGINKNTLEKCRQVLRIEELQ